MVQYVLIFNKVHSLLEMLLGAPLLSKCADNSGGKQERPAQRLADYQGADENEAGTSEDGPRQSHG